jgi:hypothetical protein
LIATWDGDGLNVEPLLDWPGAATLRYLEVTAPYLYGDHEALLNRMSRLEELHLDRTGNDTGTVFGLTGLTNLRVLEVNGEQGYALSELAKNHRSFARLEALLLHPWDEGWITPIGFDEVGPFLRSAQLPNLRRLRLELYEDGDGICQALARSKLLPHLEEVELRYGYISDKGARALAKAPALKNLKLLDVSSNHLSPAGVKALSACVTKLVANAQGDPSEREEWPDSDDWEEYE